MHAQIVVVEGLLLTLCRCCSTQSQQTPRTICASNFAQLTQCVGSEHVTDINKCLQMQPESLKPGGAVKAWQASEALTAPPA